MKAAGCLWIGLLSGCGNLEMLADQANDALVPRVVVGVITVLQEPDVDPRLGSMNLGDFEDGVGGMMMLADASDGSSMDRMLLSDSEVRMFGCGSQAGLSEDQPGIYLRTPPSQLDGCADNPFSISVWRDDGDSSVFIDLPDTLVVDLPLSVPMGESIWLDLDPDEYDTVLVVLSEGPTGRILWDNQPDGLTGWYEFLRTPNVSGMFVPGQFLLPDTVHVLTVTAFKVMPSENIDNANRLLSVAAGGRTQITAFTTREMEE